MALRLSMVEKSGGGHQRVLQKLKGVPLRENADHTLKRSRVRGVSSLPITSPGSPLSCYPRELGIDRITSQSRLVFLSH